MQVDQVYGHNPKGSNSHVTAYKSTAGSSHIWEVKFPGDTVLLSVRIDQGDSWRPVNAAQAARGSLKRSALYLLSGGDADSDLCIADPVHHGAPHYRTACFSKVMKDAKGEVYM